MTPQQLEIITGLIGGCEIALVTMADYLAKLDLLDKEALANHFNATASGLAEDIRARKIIEMVLRQIANGLRSTQDVDQASIRNLFH
jgi:hypothetical protein